MRQKRISIINGPNLNLLGQREPDIYGDKSFADILDDIRTAYPNTQFEYFQSNHEGEIIDILHAQDKLVDGIILNAGGYAHTSVAIPDAVAGIKTPVIELHISNVYAREEERHSNLLSKYAKAVISGFGTYGYFMAIDSILNS